MTPDEEKALLITEMRLAGFPSEVVNFFRVYLNADPNTTSYSKEPRDIRYWLESGASLSFDGWIKTYGHHFSDPDNLPKDDSWAFRARPGK